MDKYRWILETILGSDQQKGFKILPRQISGCFRVFDPALDFANIRSVLSTARKQNLNLLQVLTDIFSGQLPIFS